MPVYRTPGVYIEEISVFPPSVAAVETAIPAFIGYTAKTKDSDGQTLVNVPTRITSLFEFEQIFGQGFVEAISVNVSQTFNNGVLTDTAVTFNTAPAATYYLYYAMQLYFSNGGGPCYIVSVGGFHDVGGGETFAANKQPTIVADFTAAINVLEEKDEPTLLAFPDACLGSDGNVGDIVDVALAHCNKMQDRFTICDVRDAIPAGTNTNAEVNTNFRGEIGNDIEQLKYGAAYFPYLNTSIQYFTNDNNIELDTHAVSGTGAPAAIGGNTKIDDNAIKQQNTNVYNAIKAFMAEKYVVVPPSGAVAGIYARVDENRGVWKAPANVSVSRVVGPAINATNDLNDDLNIDPGTGKSVNVIRAFKGKGTLVWGARTLAGNDNEWRYVPVRRFFIFVEESVKKATERFVFEPNDANTWVKVRSMIENFLTVQWRAGALAGPTPESAFFVKVGLNETMSNDDILNGYMIVEIGMAVVRPAEFIILKFSHKMQEA